MGKKLVSNIKHFITSGGIYNNGIKSIIKGLYPNGYRNFGPDLDRMMMPLNKKYVDISKVMEQINDLASNNSNGGSNPGILNNKGQVENYFISVIKCLINYVQWDIKKERENYAKYGVLLLIKLIDGCFDKWRESPNIINYIRNHVEIWISKEGTLLKYYGKWILLCLMKKNLQGNIGILTRQTNNKKNGIPNSIPLKNCILNLKLVELTCKNLININRNVTNNKNVNANSDLNGARDDDNKNVIDIIMILEIILLGLLTQGIIFEGKSKKVIYESIIPSLASILNNDLVFKYGISFHNVRYYSINETPGQSATSTINEFIKEDNNIFFQGDKMTNQELIKYLYINYLFTIETLSIILTKEDNNNNILNSGDSNINNNDTFILNKIKNQDKINILPFQFKLLDDKLNLLYYYPYILTSDICLSICRGNHEYTIEIINTISQALRYYMLNCNTNKGDNDTLFMRNEPFFIKDEIMISLSGTNENTPKTILCYKTPQYCYSLLRCLHRILCCCPKIQGLSKWLTALVNLIDILLPLYDLNGVLCSRSKTNNALQVSNTYGNITVGINEMGRCALLLRNVSFQVLFDIMCLLSETSQVFYVIRVLVKIRDWCGSCLLDLIRRCQRLASQASGDNNINCLDKCNNYIRSHKKNELKIRSTLDSDNNNNCYSDSKLDGFQLITNNNIEMEIVDPTFWSISKINEIAGINKKWITGQIGNINNICNNGNISSCSTSNNNIQNDTTFNNKTLNFDMNNDISTSNDNNNNNNNGISIGGMSIEVGLKNQNSQLSSPLPSPSQPSFSGFSGIVSKLYSGRNKNKVKGKDGTNVSGNNIDNSNNHTNNGLLLSSPKAIVNLLNDNYLNDSTSHCGNKYNHNNGEFSHEEEDYYDDILDESDNDDDDDDDDIGRGSSNILDDEEDDDYWEVDHKLLELIKLRPTSSLINAQPPISGILRTVSSEINYNNKGSFSKIGGSISSLWTKHNSAPPRTLSSMKRVCFSEVPQIY
ncbi:hypothetical protein FG379_001141 [Cryptosporidium bovis]|uniref:uncharacterized protein n=1 Tax=Cryptosporidium bovis TaxID=310047 RepID=UPI00351A2841|nr:hypothetical protein FG379_001141 [Cryptosporidium bovis]